METKYTILEGNKVLIENLSNRSIIYRNFAGRKEQYNPNGQRKFTVVINPDDAQMLASNGWNVKIRPPKNEGDDPFCTLEVKIRLDLDWAKPKIKQFSRTGVVGITEDNIANFDQAEFEKVDIVLRQYVWTNMKGETGVSAQLSEMNAKLAQGVLDAKWAEEEGPGENDMPF